MKWYIIPIKWDKMYHWRGSVHCWLGGDCLFGLMGEYNHTIDAKGRLSIPSKFRDILGDEFVISKGIESCLYVYTKESWEKIEQKINSLSLLDKEARQFSRKFMSGFAEVELDPHGRILIKPKLREYAGLEKDVTLIGVGSRAEIWDTNKWLENNDELDMEELAGALLSRDIVI